MLNFFPCLGKLSKNAGFEMKIAMVCIVMLPLLAVLMHLYYESPAMIIGAWLFACFMLTGDLYPLVLKIWIIQVVLTTKVLRMRLVDMDRALESAGQTSMQTLNIDVTNRAEAITKGHVATQTETACTFNEYTAYVLYVKNKSRHFYEQFNLDEMNLWTARLVVLMHSKMRFHVCRMIAVCAVAYLAYGAFYVEWRALASGGMANLLQMIHEMTKPNSSETTLEDKPKVDTIAMRKLLICIKRGLCKPPDMTV